MHEQQSKPIKMERRKNSPGIQKHIDATQNLKEGRCKGTVEGAARFATVAYIHFRICASRPYAHVHAMSVRLARSDSVCGVAGMREKRFWERKHHHVHNPMCHTDQCCCRCSPRVAQQRPLHPRSLAAKREAAKCSKRNTCTLLSGYSA